MLKAIPRSPAPDLWQRAHDWPRDLDGHVFFARAILKVGKAMFEDWTGLEPQRKITAIPLPTNKESATESQRRFAHNLLVLYFPDSDKAQKQRHDNERKAGGHRIPYAEHSFTDSDWELIRPFAQERYEAEQVPLAKYASVRRAIADAATTGTLAFELRPLRGGTPRPMPQDFWNTEGFALDHRFASFTIDPARPYAVTGSAQEWLYVTSDSLEAFLASLGAKVAAPGADEYFSPYLSLAIKICRERGITRDHQPFKSELENLLEKQWRDLPPSKHLQSALATLMREPESQSGSAAPKAKKKTEKKR